MAWRKYVAVNIVKSNENENENEMKSVRKRNQYQYHGWRMYQLSGEISNET
jgi:hypothetical protein